MAIKKSEVFAFKGCSGQRWKNLGVQQIITPRRNVLAVIFDHLGDIFDHLADNFDLLADKNVRETFLRGLMICYTLRFFLRWLRPVFICCKVASVLRNPCR